MKFALSLAILASAAPAQAEFMKITLPSITFPEIQSSKLGAHADDRRLDHGDDHGDDDGDWDGPNCNTVEDCMDCDENGCEPQDFAFCAIPGGAPTRLRRSLFGTFYEGRCGDPVCMVAAPGFYDATASGFLGGPDASTQMREAGWCDPDDGLLHQWVSHGETNCDATNSDGDFAQTLSAYKHLICDYEKACTFDIGSVGGSPDKDFWCTTCKDPFISIMGQSSTPEEVGYISAMLDLTCTCNNDYTSGGDPDWCAFNDEPQECKDALVSMFASAMGMSDADFQGYLTTVTGMCDCSKQYMTPEDNYQVDHCTLEGETGECQDSVKSHFTFLMGQSEEPPTPEDIENYWAYFQASSLCACYDFGGVKFEGGATSGDSDVLGWSLMSLCSDVSNYCLTDLKTQYINLLMMSATMTPEDAENALNSQFLSTCGYAFPEE